MSKLTQNLYHNHDKTGRVGTSVFSKGIGAQNHCLSNYSGIDTRNCDDSDCIVSRIALHSSHQRFCKCRGHRCTKSHFMFSLPMRQGTLVRLILHPCHALTFGRMYKCMHADIDCCFPLQPTACWPIFRVQQIGELRNKSRGNTRLCTDKHALNSVPDASVFLRL